MDETDDVCPIVIRNRKWQDGLSAFGSEPLAPKASIDKPADLEAGPFCRLMKADPSDVEGLLGECRLAEDLWKNGYDADRWSWRNTQRAMGVR